MGEKILVGPVNRGLRNDVEPFNIDNDSFPTLTNAYQWRGRLKRKRGTSFLNRLQRFFNSTIVSYNPTLSTITLGNDGAGNGTGNLLTGFTILQPNATLVPGTIIINDLTTGNVYTDPAMNGILVGTPIGTGTINYATGAFVIAAAAGDTVTASFIYFPDLPVMGLEDFITNLSQFPGTIAFDTTFSYNVTTAFPYSIYDVSFYKNPAADPIGLPGYIPKANETPTTWNGQDYQQFWTTNYQGALWTTNGINVPFTTTNVGMQFKLIVTVTVVAGGPPAIVNLQITGHGLVVGDFVFINEVIATTGINFQTGYVIAVTDANNITVEFPFATIAGAGTGGIAQYLTNRSDPTKDSLRFYDGDPTNGSPIAPILNGTHGWVNFAPPLSQFNFSIADLPAAQYYLVGAKMIFPFKDRLLFFGPVIQTSAANSQVYLQDTVIYSQNGTPYYTASFTDSTSNYPLFPDTPPGFVPILVPLDQTATSSAYFEDVTGFGGFITAGVDQEILTLGPNEDVLIVGFTRLETRLVYSGNDIIPFNFFIINSELGSGSTFSAITMDKGIISRGSRGFIMTSQTQSQRIDLDIPDEVFQIRLLENGSERVCAQRDYINEWLYETYPVNQISYRFPTQTLQYNYRDDTWAIFRESFTTYGSFRKQTGFTWATVGTVFPTWSAWNQPWSAGASTLLQPEVIGGNQQGFVLVRDDGTDESNSLYILNIVNSIVTSPDHCLNNGDFIIISGALGTVGSQVNQKIFQVSMTTEDTFAINPPLSSGLTYLGAGVIKRMYVPFVQSRQFPVSWGMGRKTRIGYQQYLLTTTNDSQITLLIFLSQDGDNAYNDSPIVPDPNCSNNSLVYSTVLFTCPESTNLGLTPSNINLQMVTGEFQAQIWHRINTSLIGDTVQVGFTLSKDQMLSLSPQGSIFIITGATQSNPCVLTVVNGISPQNLVSISGVIGMIQLNNRTFNVLASTPTTITLEVDSTVFTPYVSGGTLQVVAPIFQFAEIEMHGFIIDVQPSQFLS
jgi:hypothetical protein